MFKKLLSRSFLETLLIGSVILFFVVLSFHAFGVTSLNQFFTTDPVFIKIWKEVLILFIFLILIIYNIFILKNIKNKFLKKIINQNFLNLIIIFFISFALILSFILLISLQTNITSVVYGIKYTIAPLFIFLLFQHIPFHIAQKIIIIIEKYFLYFLGIIICIGFLFFGISQFFPEFFITLGYSAGDSFHSIFQPLAYCQKISHTDVCRAQGLLSGPNQFGAYLVLLLSITLGITIQNKNTKNKILKKLLFLFILGHFRLFFTFSRGAWLGMFFSGIFFLIFTPNLTKTYKKKIISFILFFLIFFTGIISIFFPNTSNAVINRVSSSSQHYELSKQGVEHIIENPFGLGLGSAGAASKYTSKKGEKEVGFIPENWYLQVGIETGVIGIVLWLAIIIFTIKKLVSRTNTNNTDNAMRLSLASAFFGISIIGIFLHSWESSTVAYTTWGLAGLLLAKK